jgi:hypothetical protein
MATDRLTSLGRFVIAAAVLVALVTAGAIAYRTYTDRYTVTRDDSGLAVARVVAARLYGASELRVSRLSGNVQATAANARMWGWLKSSRVVKAPFEVGYFVDLGRLSPRDFRYDGARRTLLVEVPDVVPDTPNVDESAVTLDRTTGMFVSRTDMAALQQRVSASAQRVAAQEARKPANMARARENGRAALKRLFGGTLAAAGLPVTVEVRFAGEPRAGSSEQWDLTRSLEEVLGNAAAIR